MSPEINGQGRSREKNIYENDKKQNETT